MEGAPAGYSIEEIEQDPFIQATDHFYECVTTYVNTLSVLAAIHPELHDEYIFDLLADAQKDLISSVHDCATAIIEKTIKMDERVDLITGLFLIADAEQAEFTAKISKTEPEFYIQDEIRRYVENAYLPQNPRKFVEDVTAIFANDFEPMLLTFYKARNPHVFYESDN